MGEHRGGSKGGRWQIPEGYMREKIAIRASPRMFGEGDASVHQYPRVRVNAACIQDIKNIHIRG